MNYKLRNHIVTLKVINEYLILIRPNQWIKNIFLFAPLFFDLHFEFYKIITVALGIVIFNFAASTMYVLNDYCDIGEDKEHPVKKYRPLAKGIISKRSAITLMATLASIAFIGSICLSTVFFIIITAYITLNIAYTFKLKHIAIIDISIIAIGFILRIYAGAVLVNISPSMWIVLVTFLLALFLALAKRRDDCLLALQGKKTRKNIRGYNLEMVNSAMNLMAGVTVVSYIMYTVSPEVIHRLGTDRLYLTSFFVIIGILRYMQLTFVEQNSGSPTYLVLKDRFLQLVIVFWVASFYTIAKVII